MKIQQYDRVLLKSGHEASIVENLDENKWFIADIDKDEDTDTKEKREFLEYIEYIRSNNFNTALYSGRDLEESEDWMSSFDYVKLGSYQPEKGAITEKTTNQRLYKKENDKYIDITEMFWK